MKSFDGTREAWCESVIAVLVPELARIGIEHPAPDTRELRIAVAPTGRRTLGVCHSARSSLDGKTNFITIGTQAVEPLELVHTLAHEVLHAFDDCQAGHRGRWKRWAAGLGIQTKGHERPASTTALFLRVLAVIGTPSRHVPSSPLSSLGNLKPPSLTALECPACAQRCQYSTARLADRSIRCGNCDVPFVVAPPRLRKVSQP